MLAGATDRKWPIVGFKSEKWPMWRPLSQEYGRYTPSENAAKAHNYAIMVGRGSGDEILAAAG